MSEPGTVSSRDMEQLSAYLDGRLAPRESARLELRLRDDPRLQLELQELRATVRALRALPRARSPRTFALQPRAVPRKGRYPLLQLGTAFATLSFLVVVGIDLLLARAGVPTQAPSREFAAPLADAELAAEAPPMAQALDQAAEATPVAQPTAKAQGDEEEYARALAESAAPTATAEGDRNAELQATPSLAGELSAGEQVPAEPLVFTGEEAARPSGRLLRVAEIGLGATALILGGLTVRARRR